MTEPPQETPRTPAPVEVGVLSDKTIDEQAKWYAESLGFGRIDEHGRVDVYGVYVAGTDTPICHTGNGPTSKVNAYFIAKCFNEYEAPERDFREARKLLAEAGPYMRHAHDCIMSLPPKGTPVKDFLSCSCRLHSLLSRIKAITP